MNKYFARFSRNAGGFDALCVCMTGARGAALGLLLTLASAPASALDIHVLYLAQPVERPPLLSNQSPPPEDAGLRGAELGIADNNTTGRFLGHQYSMEHVSVTSAEEATRAAKAWLETRSGLIVADLPSDALGALTQALPLDKQGLLFNATNQDNAWRSSLCTTGLLHTAPSRAMLTDGLAQFLVARRWKSWLLVRGGRDDDIAYANSLKRAAKRFGAKVVDERVWSFDTDLRRAAQAELPLFTQARSYDVVLVADELGDVGEFVPYNTWLPRPVAGTQGLTPTNWAPVIEQWGALQLQSRFQELAGRPMNGSDYGAWLAVRAIAESVTRTGSADPTALFNYLLSEDFEIAAFMGRSLTVRAWNGQFRQPVTLVHPRAVVNQSPQEGFLHPRTELDTLGFDQREVQCTFKDRR